MVRKKKCTHPKWYFKGLTRSSLTGVQARDRPDARKEVTLGGHNIIRTVDVCPVLRAHMP